MQRRGVEVSLEGDLGCDLRCGMLVCDDKKFLIVTRSVPSRATSLVGSRFIGRARARTIARDWKFGENTQRRAGLVGGIEYYSDEKV